MTAESENTVMRGWLAKLAFAGKIPCPYCEIVDPARCKSGFPGCALADDLVVYASAVSRDTWLERWLKPSPGNVVMLLNERRVLFLDVDGVLNHREWLRVHGRQNVSTEEWRQARHRAHLDPACVARLERVITSTGCVLVLSSSWRYSLSTEEMEARLRERGAPSARVIGETPKGLPRASGLIAAPRRGEEIGAWLAQHSIDSFAIVDDDEDIDPFMDRLVRTSFESGLQDEHVNRLVEMLR